MPCSKCGFENPDGMKFCNECGSPLGRLCPNCNFENPSGSKFCGECGTTLSKEVHEAIYKREQDAERRQVTVMFCDLVGSTQLSEQLDPEDLREVMRAYQEVCAKVIKGFDGHIAKYLGDGILVYFGYPKAHEDDARRAVHAGLEVVEAVRDLPLQKKQLQQPLQVRIGIHTGLVVVGEMGGGETREAMAIVGETPNIAARLQEIAEPDTVLISSSTHRLIEGYFTFQALGSHTPRGISQPMELYKVIKESDAQSRLEIAVTRGLTPLVGRDQEIGLLLERWERVKDGEGQVVLISGEAGIGKSRLLQVLKDSLQDESHIMIESRCSPYYQSSYLYPVIGHFNRFLDFNREDSPDVKLRKLVVALEQYGFSLGEMVPLFSALLSLPIPDHYPPLNLTPERQKQKTLEALLAWLLKEAEKHPVLRIMEDLHWMDSSTLEYLGLLIEQIPTVRVFTLLTFRPDFNPPWALRSHMTQISLNRLANKQVEEIVGMLAGGKAIPDEVVQQVVAKTDGIPLFVEELTKMVLESGLLREEDGHYELIGSLPPLAIPATLQDSLMARLDRLETVKDVAQLAATLGREFSYDLLRAVSKMDEENLQIELSKLVEAELLYKRGIPPQARYFFKHALIQEAAYESLLKSKRQIYHQSIAEVLKERFPETADTEPELLAHHYTEAGLIEKAIPYWQGAGKRAIERSAHVEAINHLRKGLNLVQSIPDSINRDQKELALQIALGAPLRVIKGFAAPDVEQVYARALELCQKIGETPQFFPVMRGLCGFYIARSEIQKAFELGQQYLGLVEKLNDPALHLQAHYLLGAILFCRGEIAKALDHAEHGFSIYKPEQHRSHAHLYGQDPGVASLFWMSWALWYLGYPDQALRRSHEALTLAKKLSHPYSVAIALNIVAFIHQFRREQEAVQEHSHKSITLSTEAGFGFILPMGTILHGWAIAKKQERSEEGITLMREGLAFWHGTGAQLYLPYWLGLLAEAYMSAGMNEEGLNALSKALDTAHKNGELFYEAELYRLNGELLLSIDTEENNKEAENCFRKAIDIASKRSAKCFELRAVMSLCRLLHKQGNKKEGRQMLSDIYAWFTEGFDTRDLKEAKTLLAELE